LSAIRRRVFVQEQSVPVELEWDGLDATCRHVQARADSGEVIGTGRLLPDGHIGRLAVLSHWRGRGVGRTLMLSLIECAGAGGFDKVELNAQTQVLAFYRQLGFVAHGKEFLDAGIPHLAMTLKLNG
jgi:predicted GNAT family N-acyltransferase